MERDVAKAIEWNVKAAELGWGFAAWWLGSAHLYGQHGLTENNNEALKWYRRRRGARRRGHSPTLVGNVANVGKRSRGRARGGVSERKNERTREHAIDDERDADVTRLSPPPASDPGPAPPRSQLRRRRHLRRGHQLRPHPLVELRGRSAGPSRTPASRSVLPSACAFFAIFAAASYPMCGFSAVTSMSDDRMSSSIRSRFGSMPAHAVLREAHARLGQQLDALQVVVRDQGLRDVELEVRPRRAARARRPRRSRSTCAHTIIIASHCVGFTFPGMMDCSRARSRGARARRAPRAGRCPACARRSRSSASDSAIVFSMPLESAVCASCAASDSNLFGAEHERQPGELRDLPRPSAPRTPGASSARCPPRCRRSRAR